MISLSEPRFLLSLSRCGLDFGSNSGILDKNVLHEIRFKIKEKMFTFKELYQGNRNI